jgi:L-serine/L-threonine ammonia-lyase
VTVRPLHLHTPTVESLPLSALVEGRVLLKLDCVQPTGSFKIRGIGHACRRRRAAGARAFVASSGGNAGLAVAYAGRQLGVPVSIVIPTTTPELTRSRLQAEGAQVVVHGGVWDEAHLHALEISEATPGAAYIHPFDDEEVWAGHASLVHELAADGFAPDLIVTVVGGGGLLCGILQGLHDKGWAKVPVLTVETVGADCFARSVAAGQRLTLESIDSVATSLGARAPAPEALAWTERHEILPHTVTDGAAVDAVTRFQSDHRLLVEPACGAALAAVYQGFEALRAFGEILIVVCGGAGVTPDLLQAWRSQVADR